MELVGVDLIEEDLAANEQLDVRLTHNLLDGTLPERARGAGLITSRMVLEHIEDQDQFVGALYDALAPGGKTLHVFAGRNSAFAIANRLLPDRVSRAILFRLRPESVEVGGFTTYYDRTTPSAIERVFRSAGFEDVSVEVTYEVSQYVPFFVPLFLLARLWEAMLDRLGVRPLAAFLLVTARRPTG